ncbi:hypothetical protein [Arthrobacter sp. MDT1-65]
MLVLLLVRLIMIAVVGPALYASVGLGVKHGLRSYYADAGCRPDDPGIEDDRGQN